MARKMWLRSRMGDDPSHFLYSIGPPGSRSCFDNHNDCSKMLIYKSIPMRVLFTTLLFFAFSQLFGQACLLPESMNVLKPERCGIRYVKALDNRIEVILEFDKRARVITPVDPGNAKGKPVTLRGIYRLTYGKDGVLLSEERSYVQTKSIPEKSMFFGVNEQRGDLLESDPKLISVQEYEDIPWVGIKMPKEEKEEEHFVQQYYETNLNVNKGNQLVELEITKYVKDAQGRSGFEPYHQNISLELYDSSTKKAYWTALHPAVTDDSEGYTMAILNRFDRSLGKTISQKRIRLSSFDSTGVDTNRHEFNFDNNMQIAYQKAEFRDHPNGTQELATNTIVFTPATSTESKFIQYDYFQFDKKAELLAKSSILAKEKVFEYSNYFMNDTGTIYVSNNGYNINSLFIDRHGKYNISSTDEKLQELKKLMSSRTNHLGVNAVVLTLQSEPTVFDDKSILMVYRVEENVGVRGIDVSNNAATMICHGLAVVHMSQEGRITAAKYYQRPENADPRAQVDIGPIERNQRGVISFYATEKTSMGSYPVLYTIRRGNVNFKRNDAESTASRFIYYDSDEAIVGYFGLLTDPDDPRISIKTVEIIKDDD